MLKLSATSINMFLRCQIQYEFRYIRGIKIPPVPVTIVGISFHKALEENFKQKIQTFEDLKTEDVLDIYSTTFEEKAMEVEEWTEDKGTVKDQGVSITKTYMEQKAKEIMPNTVEEEIKITIDKDLQLVGYRDITTVDGKVIDFKSTNKTPKEIPFDYRLQLDIYSMKNDVNKAELHYVIKTKTPKIVVLENKPQPSKTIIDIATKIKEQIKAGIFIPTGLSHQWACNYCGYRNKGLCPYKS